MHGVQGEIQKYIISYYTKYPMNATRCQTMVNTETAIIFDSITN